MNYDGKEYRKKNRNLRQQLKDLGMRWQLYHLFTTDADEQEVPLEKITVCITWHPKGQPSARGVSICSQGDNVCWDVGTFYALKRVLQALKHKTNGDWIKREEVKGLIALQQGWMFKDGKSTYEPMLTETEEQLLKLDLKINKAEE